MTGIRWSVRSVYFYLVSLIMLLTLVFGSVSFVNAVIDMFQPGSSTYAPKVPGDSSRLTYLQAEMRRIYPDATDAEILQWAQEQIAQEDQQSRSLDIYYRWRRLVQAAILIVVAFPTYKYHWRRAQALSD